MNHDTYKNATDNCPEANDWYHQQWPDRPELKPWNAPHWEIMEYHDGDVEVYALRPSFKEVCEGDLVGRLGSVITLDQVNRATIKRALRLARILCKCDPNNGVVVSGEMLTGIMHIATDIPVYNAALIAA